MVQKMDMQEFDRLYAEYKPRFIVIAHSYLRDKVLAEDLVTDCFMYFWEKREEIGMTTENIPAYILGIVRHKCIDALRERQQHLQTQQQIYRIGLRNIKTYQEIAQQHNISVRKVTREIQRCLKLLREDLGDYLPLAAVLFPHLFDKT